MPLEERLGVGGDEEVFVETRVDLADLSLAVFEQQPVPLMGPEAGEVQPNDHAPVGEALRAKRVAHRPQGDMRIEVLRGDLEPTRSPLPEGPADLEQILARCREDVPLTAPLRLRCHLNNAEACELLEPLREHGVGESGRTLEDLAERLTAQIQVADDQRRPTLGEDFRSTGDRTVLAVRPHEHSVPRLPNRREVQIPYFEVQIPDFSGVPSDVAMSPGTEEERWQRKARSRFHGSGVR